MTKLFKDVKLWLYAAFIAAETAIYIAFNVLESHGAYNTVYLKYSGILLCLAFAAVNIYFCKTDALCLTAALFFTAISDIFIFILDDYYEVGLVTFIITQLIYFSRIYLTNGAKPYISLGVRLFLIAVALIALGATGNLVSVTALAAVYFPLLVCNAADSAFLCKISKRYILFFAGLLLFIGCDVCVGLYNFSSLGIALPESAERFAATGMWAFYLPSQTLIVLSVRKAKYKPFFLKNKTPDGGDSE